MLHPTILGATVLPAHSKPAAITDLFSIEPTTNAGNPENSMDSKDDNISSTSSSRDVTTVSSLPSSLPYNDFPKRSEARILLAGCGDSLLPFDMIQAGWTGGIVGIDFSSVVIEKMKGKALQSRTILETAAAESKHAKAILDYNCADLTKALPYSDGSFDLILVKGTFDAILCSSGSRSNILKLVQNCVRLLSSNHGVLFIISTGNPDNRLEYLEFQNELTHFWRNVSVHPLRNSKHTTGSIQPP